jgi:alpha-galactosidase
VSDSALHLQYFWQQLGLDAGDHVARDLWLHKNLGKTSGVDIKLAPHASVLYRVN